MKRVFAIVFTCALLAVFSCLGVSAATGENVISEMTTEQLAYLDVESASKEMQEKILAARKEIIYSTDWVADGYDMYIGNMATGEVERKVPHFSEVFPGWEIPTEDFSMEQISGIEGLTTTSSVYTNVSETQPASTTDELVFYNAYDVYMTEATDEQAEPFAEIYANPYTLGSAIRTVVEMLGASETCNIGYSDAATGKSIAYATNLIEGQYVDVTNVGDMDIYVRASTYSTPDLGLLSIYLYNRES